MLNKNDPLVGAIQDIMRKNQAERDAVKAVNEKFGVQDRRVLPREKQGEWDVAYQSILTEGVEALDEKKLIGNQPNIDVASADGKKKPDGKLTKHDFAHLRAKKKPMEEENAPKTDPYAEGQASSISTVAQTKKEVTPSDQSALKKKIQSIKEAKSNAYAIGMAAVKKSTGDEPPMEKKNITKAHEIAKKILAKKKMNEGFNNRHDSSVTASAEKQVVAELYAVPGTPAGNAYEKTLSANRGKPALPLQANQKMPFRDKGVRRPVAPIKSSTSSATRSSSGVPTMAPGTKLNRPTGNYNPAAGTGTPPVTAPANPMMGQTQRQNFVPGAAAAAKRANMSGGGGNYAAPGAVAAGAAAAAKRANMSGGGGNYAAARKPSIVSTGNPKMASSAGSGMSARDPKSSNALSAKMRQTAGQRQGATAPPKPSTVTKPSIAADNPVVSKTTTNPVEPKTFKDAFAAARKAAAEKGSTSTGTFKFKGKEYQTNTKGEKYVAASKQTDVTPKPTTTTSVTGGQGISGIASNSTNKPIVKPTVDAKAQGFAPAGIASRPATGVGPQQAPKPAAPTPDAMSNLGRVSQRTSGPSTSLDSPSPRATSQQSSEIAKNVYRANVGLPLPPRNKIQNVKGP